MTSKRPVVSNTPVASTPAASTSTRRRRQSPSRSAATTPTRGVKTDTVIENTYDFGVELPFEK